MSLPSEIKRRRTFENRVGFLVLSIMKAHQAYRERLRRLMVVPAPGVDQKESMIWKRHSGVSMEVVDLVSDTDDD